MKEGTWERVGINPRWEFYASPEYAMDEGNFGFVIASCSLCNVCMPELKEVLSTKDNQYMAIARVFRFCPICGAKMKVSTQ